MGGHTYTDCTYHVIFSTKDRRHVDLAKMQTLYRYMAGIARNNGFKAELIGGMQDHVHAVLRIPTTISLAKAIQRLKGSSSKWFNEQHPTLQFAWQQGFAAFTVSHSNLKAVLNYVRNQETHHAKRDFAAEFKALLDRHHVDYDPRYIFG